VSYLQVDYHDLASLTSALTGFDTCLSFVIALLDTDNVVQKNLIHACIAAGVRRFAPSEWAIASNSGVPPYANKDALSAYLADLKAKGELRQLQYCLFQPSVFLDYLAHPYPLSPDFVSWPLFLDFENRRAMLLDDGTYPIVMTSVADASSLLAAALVDPEPWPVVGGMQGARTNINELIALGKKIRGGEWAVEHVASADVERGELKTSWVPQLAHPVIPVDQRGAFSKQFVLDFFLAMKSGAWDVGREWNERAVGVQVVGLEEYLTKAWEGKA
jgi:hypothetical protein